MTILANKGLAYGTLRGRGILRDGLPPGLVLFGLVSPSIPDLIDAIVSAPGDYPDGTPVYVGDPDSPTVGWVIVYSGVPVAVSYPDAPSFQAAIDEYGIPTGVTTYVVDTGGGDGEGGFMGNQNGTATPIDQTIGLVCGYHNSGKSWPVIKPIARSPGSGTAVDLDLSEYVSTGTIV